MSVVSLALLCLVLQATVGGASTWPGTVQSALEELGHDADQVYGRDPFEDDLQDLARHAESDEPKQLRFAERVGAVPQLGSHWAASPPPPVNLQGSQELVAPQTAPEFGVSVRAYATDNPADCSSMQPQAALDTVNQGCVRLPATGFLPASVEISCSDSHRDAKWFAKLHFTEDCTGLSVHWVTGKGSSCSRIMEGPPVSLQVDCSRANPNTVIAGVPNNVEFPTANTANTSATVGNGNTTQPVHAGSNVTAPNTGNQSSQTKTKAVDTRDSKANTTVQQSTPHQTGVNASQGSPTTSPTRAAPARPSTPTSGGSTVNNSTKSFRTEGGGSAPKRFGEPQGVQKVASDDAVVEPPHGRAMTPDSKNKPANPPPHKVAKPANNRPQQLQQHETKTTHTHPHEEAAYKRQLRQRLEQLKSEREATSKELKTTHKELEAANKALKNASQVVNQTSQAALSSLEQLKRAQLKLRVVHLQLKGAEADKLRTDAQQLLAESERLGTEHKLNNAEHLAMFELQRSAQATDARVQELRSYLSLLVERLSHPASQPVLLSGVQLQTLQTQLSQLEQQIQDATSRARGFHNKTSSAGHLVQQRLQDVEHYQRVMAHTSLVILTVQRLLRHNIAELVKDELWQRDRDLLDKGPLPEHGQQTTQAAQDRRAQLESQHGVSIQADANITATYNKYSSESAGAKAKVAQTSSPLCDPPCSIFGECVAANQCSCSHGYTGSTCSQPPGPVCDFHCGHGNCTARNTCTCEAGWNGTQCVSPVCKQPSLHGVCVRPDEYNCHAGWSGPLCGQAVCESPVCTAHGSCTAPNTCTCDAGYTGSACEQPVCEDCKNGNCTQPFTCSCSEGWTGEKCDVPICRAPCSAGVCIAPDTCRCSAGYQGATCDTAVCNPPCSVNGDCVAPNTCTCRNGFSGPDCTWPMEGQCTPMCGHHGSCTRQLSCPSGNSWNVSRASYTEGHLAGCKVVNVCRCASGYSGDACKQPVCSPACQNGGQCLAPNVCSCPRGYSGLTCQLGPVCTGGCGQGRCVDNEVCECDRDWTGPRCSVPVPVCSAGCVHGQCMEAAAQHKAELQAATPTTTAEADSVDMEPAAKTPLASKTASSSGASASAQAEAAAAAEAVTAEATSSPTEAPDAADYRSESPADRAVDSLGLGGTKSELEPPAFLVLRAMAGHFLPSNNSAANGSTANSSATPTHPEGVCVCQAGWGGVACSVPTCSSPCRNGYRCTAPDTCTCPPGWTGADCDVPPPNVCQPACNMSNGYCAPDQRCVCNAPWQGTDCNERACPDCGAHGSCPPNPRGKCNCTDGWSGDACDVAPPPSCGAGCNNGGVCTVNNTCRCDAGWTGSTCSQPVCAVDCGPHGTCSAPNNCTCRDGFFGASCRDAPPEHCEPACGHGSCRSLELDAQEAQRMRREHQAANKSKADVAPNGFRFREVQPMQPQQDSWPEQDDSPLEPSEDDQRSADPPTRATATATEPNAANTSSPPLKVSYAFCECAPGWQGYACDVPTCESGCGSHGSCVAPQSCLCRDGWQGEHCGIPPVVPCSPACGPEGVCWNGTCMCDDDDRWTGPTCQTPVCRSGCGHNRECVAPGVCGCKEGYTGSHCEVPPPHCPNGCGGHGYCIVSKDCTEGSGASCVYFSKCRCFDHFAGPSCEVQCAADCGTHGQCGDGGQCVCSPHWGGERCDQPLCSPVCGPHGICRPGGLCTCRDGWNGTDCSNPPADWQVEVHNDVEVHQDNTATIHTRTNAFPVSRQNATGQRMEGSSHVFLNTTTDVVVDGKTVLRKGEGAKSAGAAPAKYPDIYGDGGSWQQAAGTVQGPGVNHSTRDPLSGSTTLASQGQRTSFGQAVNSTTSTMWGGAAAPEFAPSNRPSPSPPKQTQPSAPPVPSPTNSPEPAAGAASKAALPATLAVALFSDLACGRPAVDVRTENGGCFQAAVSGSRASFKATCTPDGSWALDVYTDEQCQQHSAHVAEAQLRGESLCHAISTNPRVSAKIDCLGKGDTSKSSAPPRPSPPMVNTSSATASAAAGTRPRWHQNANVGKEIFTPPVPKPPALLPLVPIQPESGSLSSKGQVVPVLHPVLPTHTAAGAHHVDKGAEFHRGAANSANSGCPMPGACCVQEGRVLYGGQHLASLAADPSMAGCGSHGSQRSHTAAMVVMQPIKAAKLHAPAAAAPGHTQPQVHGVGALTVVQPCTQPSDCCHDSEEVYHGGSLIPHLLPAAGMQPCSVHRGRMHRLKHKIQQQPQPKPCPEPHSCCVEHSARVLFKGNPTNLKPHPGLPACAKSSWV